MSCQNNVSKPNKTCDDLGSPPVTDSQNIAGKYFKDFTSYFKDIMKIAKETHESIAVLDENFFHTCYEELAFLYGKFSLPIPADQNPFGNMEGDPETRWRTALKFAIDHRKDCIYTEGFAIINENEPPIEHAWVTDRKTGQAIDPTYGSQGKAYFGIQFNLDYVVKKSKEVSAAGLLQSGNDLETKSPILQYGLPVEAVQKL